MQRRRGYRVAIGFALVVGVVALSAGRAAWSVAAGDPGDRRGR